MRFVVSCCDITYNKAAIDRLIEEPTNHTLIRTGHLLFLLPLSQSDRGDFHE